MPRLSIAILLLTCAPCAMAGGVKVTFDDRGDCCIDGKRFFPIGIWVYNLDTNVMADLHEHRFNTIVGGGFKPADLGLIEQHGMMCIPLSSDEFIKSARSSPSLLAWYLEDEPEEHGMSPAQIKQRYDALKATDADHPIGLTHCELAGPPKYKDACDFTMTDVYPITANREWPISAVGRYTDGPRQVHGANWPNFTFIQTFGGPDSDGGKWAQPLPHEVRCMAMQALVHRTNGILYFSYWPRAAQTWASIAELNQQIDRLTPWLLADGEESPATSSAPAVEIRAKRVGQSWMVIAVSTSSKPLDAQFNVPGLGDAPLRVLTEDRIVRPAAGQWPEAFAPFEARVYLAGDEPK
jgi:hypothetical protein